VYTIDSKNMGAIGFRLEMGGCRLQAGLKQPFKLLHKDRRR